MNKIRLLEKWVSLIFVLVLLVGCAAPAASPTPAATSPAVVENTPVPTVAPAVVNTPVPTAAPAATVEATTAPAATTAAPAPGGVDEAKQLVKALEQPVSFQAPGPALNIGTSMKGKKIYFIANGLNFPFVQNLLGGLKQAADLVGMEVTAVDGAGASAKASSLVEQGVSQKADLIIIQSFPAEQLTASLKEAKDAKIPVLELFGRDPQLPSAELKAVGVEGIVSYCYSCAGQQMAQFAVAESGGKVNAVVFDVPEIGTAKLERDGFVNELKRLCPTCTAKVVNAPLAQWNDSLPKLTTSLLQADPTINYMIPLYDSMIALMEPQIIAANAQGSVKIVSYNGTLPGLQGVAKGEIVSGDVGGMNAWIGWATMDQILRVLSGAPAVADPKVPHRLFDAANIKSIDLTKDESVWYGAIDLKKEYSALWGIK